MLDWKRSESRFGSGGLECFCGRFKLGQVWYDATRPKEDNGPCYKWHVTFFQWEAKGNCETEREGQDRVERVANRLIGELTAESLKGSVPA